MAAFNPLWINRYSQTELLAFLACGYTLDDFKMCGNADKTVKALSEAMNSSIVINDDTIFNAACDDNSIEAYNRYLELLPDGLHASECQAWISSHKSKSELLTQSLIEDMRTHPWQYRPEELRLLIYGDYHNKALREEIKESNYGREYSPLEKIVIENPEIDMARVARCVKPREMSENDWLAIWNKTPYYQMPQCTGCEMSKMLKWGRDVFMLGISGCGQTSLIAALINYTESFLNGKYEPHLIKGKDVSLEYYKAIRDIIPSCRFPARPSHQLCFLHFTALKRKITFIEHSGYLWPIMCDDYRDYLEEWELSPLRACFENDNDKTLLFLFDCGAVGTYDERRQSVQQSLLLERMIQILMNNGSDHRNPTKGCTMSRVKNLALIFTKADLLSGEPSVSNWLKQCETLMNENYNYMSFPMELNHVLMKLNHACKMYNINKKNQHQPYVFAHSIGEPLVGQCFNHKVETTKAIAKFIFET